MNLEHRQPNAVEAEKAMLGGVILNNALMDEARVLVPSPSMFYPPSHQHIYGCMMWLREHSQPVDPVVIWHMLKTDGYGESTPMSYVTNLTSGLPFASSIKHYATLVRDAWTLRSGISELAHLTELFMEGGADPDSLLAMAEEKFASMRERSAFTDRKGGILSSLQPEADAYLSLIESGVNPAIPTGISTLDHLWNGGMMPGNLIGIVARSGEGKSLMLKQWLQHTARRGVHGALFSLEMSSLQNVLRLLSAGAGVPLHHLAWGANKADLGRVRDVMPEVMKLPIHIYGDCRSIKDIWSRVKEIKRRHPLGWVGIDYFQLANGRGSGKDRYENKTAELEYVANTAKEMAETEQLPVVMPAQFNQEGAKQEHPQIENVRGGMAYFNACDICATLVTSEYKSGLPTRDSTLYIKKNRNGLAGDAGIIDMVLDNRRLEFHPVSKDAVPERERREYL